MRYTTKPKSIKINQETFSLSSSDYRYMDSKNFNFISINDLITRENVWEQINVNEYLWFKTKYYLGTISWMSWLIYNEKEWWENISPIIFNKSSKKISNWEIIVSRNATLWKASYVNWEISAILNWWLTNLYIDNLVNRFYLFSFFINPYLKEQLILKTSAWWTQQNAKRQNVLDLQIPFPTKNNNTNPEKIEKLISLITQNLIDKEQKIKEKNKLINEYIENELNKNQKYWKEKNYNLPKINELLDQWRLDTWMYNTTHKKLLNKILNYSNWYFYLDKKQLNWWDTPKKRVFEPYIKKFLWITPTDINWWLLGEKKYIKAEKYNLWNDFALLFSNRSNCWEWILYSPKYAKWWHHNQWIYRKVFKEDEIEDNIFILCLFNSKYYKELIKWIATGSTFPELRIEQYINIPLPDFEENIKNLIYKNYYNKLDNNIDITFDNYLEKEKERNSKLWIFQLNMEIFSLREKLDELIDKIIKEEPIEIDFTY